MTFIIVLVMIAILFSTNSAQDIPESNNITVTEESKIETEVGTVISLEDDTCILETRTGDLYQIHNFSDQDISVSCGEDIAFSYTEKTEVSNGMYDIVVDWIDRWENFDADHIITGA